MKHSYGDKWRELFDFVIVNANKPLFFRAAQPFIEYCDYEKNGKGKKYWDIKYLMAGASQNVFMEGNATMFTSFLQKFLSNDYIKIAHFGDHLLNDVFGVWELNQRLTFLGNRARWDSFAVVQEFGVEEPALLNEASANLIPFNTLIWGTNYFFDMKEDVLCQISGQDYYRNFFIANIEKASRYAIASLQNLDKFCLYRTSEKASKIAPDRREEALCANYERVSEPVSVIEDHPITNFTTFADIPFFEHSEFYVQATPLNVESSMGLKKEEEKSDQESEVLQNDYSLPDFAAINDKIQKEELYIPQDQMQEQTQKMRLTPAKVDDLMGIVDQDKLFQTKPQGKPNDYGEYVVHFNYLDDVTTIRPGPNQDHRFTIIWMHEVGGHGKNHVRLFTDLLKLPPGCKVLLPTAKERSITSIGADVTTWYDICTATWPEYQPVTDSVLKNKFDQDQMTLSEGQIVDLIDEEVKRLGDARKVFLGGFLQGAGLAMASWIDFDDSEQQLGGLFCIGGANFRCVEDWKAINIYKKKQTPVKLYLGSQDTFTKPKHARQSLELLKEQGLDNVQLMVEEDLHHQISDRAIQEMQNFFDSEMNLKVKNRSIVNKIVASTNSKRTYRYIQLKNQMRVMVVNDPNCANEVSVSMQIMVGSLNDPAEFPGLARLCAMCIQKGSLDFPAENHYQWLVKKHSGKTIHSIKEDFSTFAFNFDPCELVEKKWAIDRILQIFASFFKNPLFNGKVVQKQIDEIQKIYEQDYTDQTKVLDQLVRSEIVTQDCILNTFETGSADTLRKPDIQQKLEEFFKANYSSNLMSLVIVGKESLDELQEFAESHFSDIENKSCTIKDYKQEILFDRRKGLNSLFKVQPLKQETRELIIKWPKLPDQRPFWRTKSLEYIIDLVNDLGEQSLLPELKRQKLATEIIAKKLNRLHNMKSGLQIKVKLTEAGTENCYKVIKTIYAMFNFLKDNPKRSQFLPSYFQKQMYIRDSLRFQNDQIDNDCLEHADYLASQLRQWMGCPPIFEQFELPMFDILYKPYAREQHCVAEIQDLLSKLRPEQSYIILLTQLKGETQCEKHYGTKFKVERLSLDFQKECLTAHNENLDYPPRREQTQDFSLSYKAPSDQEEEQECIYERFLLEDIIEKDMYYGELELALGLLHLFDTEVEEIVQFQVGKEYELPKITEQQMGEHPILVSKQTSKVWFKRHLNEHKIYANVKVTCSDCEFGRSIIADVFYIYWETLAKIKNRKNVPIQDDFTWDLKRENNDNFLQILMVAKQRKNLDKCTTLFKNLRKLDCNEAQFEELKAKVIQNIELEGQVEGFTQTKLLKQKCFDPRDQSLQDLIKVAQEFDLDLFRHHCKQWLSNCNIEWLVQGNLATQELDQIVSKCEKSMDIKSKVSDEQLQNMSNELVVLPEKSVFTLDQHAQLDSQIDQNQVAPGVILVHFQCSFSCEAWLPHIRKASFDVLKVILATHFPQWVYNKLADSQSVQKDKIYAHFDSTSLNDDLEFTLQSDEHSPEFLESIVNLYLKDLKQKDWSDKKQIFETVKQEILQCINEVKDSIQDDTKANWQKILEGNGEPDFALERAIKEKALNQITIGDIERFYNEVIFEQVRRLNIRIYPQHLRDFSTQKSKESNDNFYADTSLFGPLLVSQQKVANPSQLKEMCE